MKRWLWWFTLVLATPAWVQNTVYFTDDFEDYTGQAPTLAGCNPANTNPLELYDNPCNTADPLWRLFDVWHGVPAPPNLQLVNTANPYPHPDPCFMSLPCLFADPYLTQPDPIPPARSGVQMLWAQAAGSRTQYVNLSVAAPGGLSPENPLYDGAYYDFWFYDNNTFNATSRAMVEFRSYGDLSAGVPATTLLQIYSLGPYDVDSGVPPDGRALNRKTYNIRGDISTGRLPSDANPRSWADFRQVMRSTGWHHAAIWLTLDDQGNARVTYVVDGVVRYAPRNPAHRMTTAVFRRLVHTSPGRVESIYYDDAEVGVGTPPAFEKALFVGKVLPGDWHNDANGFLDVAEWIVDVEIRDMNNHLLATLERRLPKKDPTYNFADGPEDYTGLIGVADVVPPGDYKLRFKLRDRHWVPASITISGTSRDETVVLRNGDLNLNEMVDDGDVARILVNHGFTPDGDLNGDGNTDNTDLGIGLGNFGSSG